MSGFTKRLFTLSKDMASPAKLGFDRSDPEVEARLWRIIDTFVDGYNLAVETEDWLALNALLDSTYDDHHRGFAYEGVGMYLALRDLTTPFKSERLKNYTTGPGRPHHFIATVGAGFAVARVPLAERRVASYMRSVNPGSAWCVYDGYGFHQAMFDRKKYVDEARVPRWLPDFGKRPYFGGIGRAMWWLSCANPETLAQMVADFPESAREDLWHGIGIACAYAGGIDFPRVDALLEVAGPHRVTLLAGYPYAVHMRMDGGNLSEWTASVTRRYLGYEPSVVYEATTRALSFVADFLGSSEQRRIEESYPLAMQRIQLELNLSGRATPGSVVAAQ